MHDELWAGVGSKFQNAEFHRQRMGQALDPPERNHLNAALESMDIIVDTGWQRALYAHLDAFLSATRSLPEITQCCFGVDLRLNGWFNSLAPEEQHRRRQFRDEFKTAYDDFRALDLGNARHVSEHRAGYPPVEAEIKGFFGGIYFASPIKTVPISETREMDDPRYQFLAKPRAIRPNWQDFKIDGKPLFPECEKYLVRAQTLIDDARVISDKVHGNKSLTPPPP
jgi:hypothetical protein